MHQVQSTEYHVPFDIQEYFERHHRNDKSSRPLVLHLLSTFLVQSTFQDDHQHRANDIAWRLNEGKFDLLGRIYAGIGEPLCWLIGNFTGNKQINELNIKNWRKA